MSEFNEASYLRRLENVREAMKRYRARLKLDKARWREELDKKRDFMRDKLEKIHNDPVRLTEYLERQRRNIAYYRAKNRITEYIIQEAINEGADVLE